MDRNITNEVSKWVKGSHFSRFREAFWAFEDENFETGRIPKQKDIERFQKKAKVPLVGEIYRSIEDSNTTQGLESTGKVIRFSPWRQFKVSEHLKKLFFDFAHIKFVPGIVHFQPERIYSDDYKALRFLEGSLRILKGLCLSAIEGRIEEQHFLSSDLAGTFICTGGPVSNAISRIAMQYGRKERDPTKGLLRIIEPLINLRYEPVYDVEEVISEAGCIVRFIDNQIHRAPNWFIRDTKSGELLKPAKRKKDDVLATDFLLISILPNILDRESYERGDKIQIFGGTHGVGTRAVELVCSDNSLIDQINGLAGKLPHWQALLEVDEIEHSKGESRPVSLRSDIRWCEVTFNETELDEWFGRYRRKLFRRPNVKKNGRVKRTASRVSVHPRTDSRGRDTRDKEIAMNVNKPADPETIQDFEDFNDPPLWGQDPEELEKAFGVTIKVLDDKPDEFSRSYAIRVSGSRVGVRAFRKAFLAHQSSGLSHIG
jgi:hypothetical protein